MSTHNICFRGEIRKISALSTLVGPLPGSWLAACVADLTPNLKVYLS